MLICILGEKLGTPTKNAKSGTIEEIQLFKKSGKPLMIYFKNYGISLKSDADELKKVQAFRLEIQDEIYYSDIDKFTDLQENFNKHLSMSVNEFFNIDTSVKQINNTVSISDDDEVLDNSLNDHRLPTSANYQKYANILLTNDDWLNNDYIYVIRIIEKLKDIAKTKQDSRKYIFDFLCEYIKKRTKIDKEKWYRYEINWLNLDNETKVLKTPAYDVQLCFNILYSDCVNIFDFENKEVNFTNLGLQNISFLGMKVSNTDFSHSFMQHAKMFEVDKNIKSKFVNCKFNNTFLDAAHMTKAEFLHCSFINTKLRWANMWGCIFTDITFNSCDMTGSILTETHIINCAFDSCIIDASEIVIMHFESETLFNKSSFCFASVFSDSFIHPKSVSFNNCVWAGAETSLDYYHYGRVDRLKIYIKNINSNDQIRHGSVVDNYSSNDYLLFKEMKYLSIFKTIRDYCLPNNSEGINEIKDIITP